MVRQPCWPSRLSQVSNDCHHRWWFCKSRTRPRSVSCIPLCAIYMVFHQYIHIPVCRWCINTIFSLSFSFRLPMNSTFMASDVRTSGHHILVCPGYMVTSTHMPFLAWDWAYLMRTTFPRVRLSQSTSSKQGFSWTFTCFCFGTLCFSVPTLHLCCKFLISLLHI